MANAGLNVIKLSWSDPGTGESTEVIARLPLTLGRAPDNSVVINSQQVSRYHARLENVKDALFIEDLKSTNGIVVNGEDVKKSRIMDGGSFQIGHFFFTVLYMDEGEAEITQPQLTIRWSNDAGLIESVTAESPIMIGRARTHAITLMGVKVSRNHAQIEWEDGKWVLTDLGSTNGTQVNGKMIEKVAIQLDDKIQIGAFSLEIAPDPNRNYADATQVFGTADATQMMGTQVFQTNPIDATIQIQDADLLLKERGDAATAQHKEIPTQARDSYKGPFPPIIFSGSEFVSLDDLREYDYPIDENVYLSIGGGLGSFIWADHLRIHGIPTENVTVIGVEEKPYNRFQRLIENSQIPETERLRSHSDARVDNIWGFPGYAVEEMQREVRGGKIGKALKIGLQLLSEPDLSQPYTPRAGDVLTGIDREASRIGWDKIWVYGRVRAIRKTDDGRYVVAYSQTSADAGRVHKFYVAKYLHVAVGYPAIRFLSDLQAYRLETKDFKRVVNAYENHNHVYEHLQARGGVVLIRGTGEVASRVLAQLSEMHAKNSRIRVLHLMRTPKFKGHKFGALSRRKTANHWEYQHFNWPKAAYGGDMRAMIAKAAPEQREQYINDWGGVTIPRRRNWTEMMQTAIDSGWYQARFGHVERVEKDEDSERVVTIIRGKTVIQGASQLIADFIIDATGLEASLEHNPLFKDLLTHYHLPLNVKKRLDVNNNFEIESLQNEGGRVFASGSITLGAPFAPVDTFLGLQYAAQRSVAALIKQRAPGLKRLGPLRSLRQWRRWRKGVTP